MGSSVTSVGSKGGKVLVAFTASGQDTGSLFPHMSEATRWGKWLFQLTGTGTGYSVTVYGTIDIPTAYNLPGNNAEWFELPAPSTESGSAWSNPLTIPDNRALYVTAPLVAIRAVSDTQIGFPGVTGTVSLQVLTTPG